MAVTIFNGEYLAIFRGLSARMPKNERLKIRKMCRALKPKNDL
jgi:hypothetical protein